MTMSRINVVVPCHRARHLPWVLAALERQTFRNFRLIVIENGEAVGACTQYNIPADVVLTSDAHVVHARNTGVEWVKRNGGGRVAMLDGDDWYGARYLEELATAFETHVEAPGSAVKVLGKHRHFCYLRGNGLYLFADRWHDVITDVLHGPTLAFRAEDAVEYPMQLEAEEYGFCQAMRKAGGKVRALGIHHFCYFRGNTEGHTWKTSNGQLLRNSASPGCAAYWFGPRFDPMLVDGEREWRSHVISQASARHTMPFAIPLTSPVPLRQLQGPVAPMGRGIPDGVMQRMVGALRA